MLRSGLLVAAGLGLVGCSEPYRDPHAIEEHFALFSFDHDPVTETYRREIGVAFDSECRVHLDADRDRDGHTDTSWFQTCTDQERIQGLHIMSDERLAIYEAEAGDIEDPDRHCSLYVELAPHDGSMYLFFNLSTDYGPEVREMFAFFDTLFDAHDPMSEAPM